MMRTFTVVATNRKTGEVTRFPDVYDMNHIYGEGHQTFRLLIKSENGLSMRVYIDLDACNVQIVTEDSV